MDRNTTPEDQDDHNPMEQGASEMSCWEGFLPWRSKEFLNEHSRCRPAAPKPPPGMLKLFYDGDKKLTVAVLSKQLDNPSLYFQWRVEQGTAFQRSALYYELDGYVRENLTRIRHQKCFGSHDVSLAVGSLDASDEAQRDELTAERQDELHETLDDGLLEQALEIARLHRLHDDLDAMSIFFMRQASKGFNRVATRLARQRLLDTALILRPFTDGIWTTGYSTFVREDPAERPEQCLESTRTIEYSRRNDISLMSSLDGVKNFRPRPNSAAALSWDCQELALANLHRWWGDIAISEYVGQKLVLYWSLNPSHADFVDNESNDIVHLATLRLDADLSKGVRSWPMLLSSITLDVAESRVTNLDDVTTSYRGTLRVRQVDLNFISLVRATARSKIGHLKKHYIRVEETRPLLEHETDYLQQVQDLAGL